MSQIQSEGFPCIGGLDLKTPALQLQPGNCIDAVNFEPNINGGYRRMYGYERFSGQPTPSASSYWLAEVVLSGTVVVGNTITGGTSGATGYVLQLNTNELVLTNVIGTFVAESIKVSNVVIGTVSTVLIDSALTPILHANYLSIAANHWRSLIGVVPGSNPIRGVWYYEGVTYAIRDNVNATAANMYKSTNAGWVQVPFGQEILFAQYQASVTITIAAPGVVTWTGHVLTAGQAVIFEAQTGAVLPTGLSNGVIYYVVAPAVNTFEVAATVGGAAITTTGTASGTILCTLTLTEVYQGNTVTGGTSGATGIVQRALLRTGTWSTSPIGSLVFDTVTGTFQSGEALVVGGNPQVQTTTANTAISLKAGGRCVFKNYSFNGNVSNYYAYFADGVNFLSEFDGTRLVPIRTGILNDAPDHLRCHLNMIVCSVSSSIQVSGIGQPYSWTALTGAAELAIGDKCTGMLERPSNAQNAAALVIYTGSTSTNVWNTYTLYGSSPANFQLVMSNPGAGASPFTAQSIGDGYSLDTKGVVKMEQTLAYGNFEMSTVTRAIQPIIDAHIGMATASCIVRSTDQYRVFYNDGTGFIVYIKGKQTPTMLGDILTTDAADIMPFDYSRGIGVYFNMVESIVDSTGIERIFAGGSDGYVYELERGSSMDGTPINAHILMAFNSEKSPRNRKRFHRTIFQATVKNTAQVSIGYDMDYAGSNTGQGIRTSPQLNPTGGGLWDLGSWDSNMWDSPYLVDYTVDTPGTGVNFAILIYANNAIDYPFTIQSIISNFSIGRLQR